jgi:ArsR family transcriptional regulator, nickel/cobalt-responsive transcriptional repressor
VSHGGRSDPADLLDRDLARQVAETMQALATPSRLRILARLYEGPASVSEICESVGMDGSAVSHQLRVLRHLGLVVGERDGRRVNYSLHDEHVGQLMEQAMSHVEHLRLGLSKHTHRHEAVPA